MRGSFNKLLSVVLAALIIVSVFSIMTVSAAETGKTSVKAAADQTYYIGDTIDFGKSAVTAYIDDSTDPEEISGLFKLGYDKYDGEYEQHVFILATNKDNKKLYVTDENSSKPSGLRIECGDGTDENPFMFEVVFNGASPAPTQPPVYTTPTTAPATKAPVTQTPETQAPETQAPAPVKKSGVVKLNEVFCDGETISFGKAAVYAVLDDESNTPVEVSGSYTLRYNSYYLKYSQHRFDIKDETVCLYISDTDTSIPWGIRVKSGDGTYNSPFRFEVLHTEYIPEATEAAPATNAPSGNDKNGIINLNNTYYAGDTINFGTDGVYVVVDDEGNYPEVMTGSYKLEYETYFPDYRQHGFSFEDSELHMYISDADSSRPSGVMVKSGNGTEDNPFTFSVLHSGSSAEPYESLTQPATPQVTQAPTDEVEDSEDVDDSEGKDDSDDEEDEDSEKQSDSGKSSSKKDISNWKVIGIKNKAYSGKKVTQSVMVTNGKVLATFRAQYKDNNKAGKAVMIIYGTGKYTGFIIKTFTIYKKKQPAKISVYKKNLKAKDLKKKSLTVSPFKLKKAKGKITYTKVKSGSSKSIYGKITVNKKNGKLKFKKGKYRKGSYKIAVNIRISGNKIFKAATYKKIVKIKLK